MKLNNGVLHAMQLCGGSTQLAEKLEIKKATISYVLRKLDGYCPYYIRHKIQEVFPGITDDEFLYYTEKKGFQYITRRWLESTLLIKYKTQKVN